MRATRELLVETPPEALWPLLWDVPRMAACLPGCTDAQEVTPHQRYRARMTQKVGPISLSVPLDVEILAAEPPHHLALSARGRDPLVGAEISMRVTIDCEPAGAGRATLDRRRGPGAGQARRPRPGHHPAQGRGGARRVRPPARAGSGRPRRRMLRPFALHRPSTLGEVGALLAEHGDEAALYAGGTELLLLMKEGFIRPRVLVDVKRIPGLGTIRRRRRRADRRDRHASRGRALDRAPRARVPLVAGVARHVANVRVRNVGTVGGNLAFADPHSDLATLFLAFDARVALVASRRARASAAGRVRPRAVRDGAAGRRAADRRCVSRAGRGRRRLPT